jgi:hypothetical protein
MGWRWLDLARALLGSNRKLARECLEHSASENPLMRLSPTWRRTQAQTGPEA